MATEDFTFPTRFHEVASNIYSGIPKSRELASFILAHLDEEKIVHFHNIYTDSTQFNRFEKMNNLWHTYYTEEDDALSGDGIDMLTFMLDAYSRDKALATRARKLAKGKI